MIKTAGIIEAPGSAPSPGTPGEGWGEGREEVSQETLTLPSPGVPGEGKCPRLRQRIVAAFPLFAVLFLLLSGGAEPATSLPSNESAARFSWVDVYIDPKGQPLAAYQFELTAPRADVTLVGVEGGEHPAYAEPPYYDPRANLQNRIVIAAFNVGDNLPREKTRVARVMIRATGAPNFSARLDVAASINGKPIPADIQVSEGAAQ